MSLFFTIISISVIIAICLGIIVLAPVIIYMLISILVFIYAIPFNFYCAGILSKEVCNDIFSVCNHTTRLFLLATKYYLCVLTFRKPKHPTKLFVKSSKA